MTTAKSPRLYLVTDLADKTLIGLTGTVFVLERMTSGAVTTTKRKGETPLRVSPEMLKAGIPVAAARGIRLFVKVGREFHAVK